MAKSTKSISFFVVFVFQAVDAGFLTPPVKNVKFLTWRYVTFS